MISFNPQIPPTVVNNHISVEAAAEFSGYSLQYLRRLLRAKIIELANQIARFAGLFPSLMILWLHG